MQNGALRIEGGKWNVSVADLHRKYEILNLNGLYLFELGKVVFKFYRNRLPKCFDAYLEQISGASDYKTRGVTTNNCTLPSYSTVEAHRLVKFQGAKLWNSIHGEIKNSSLHEFKTRPNPFN